MNALRFNRHELFTPELLSETSSLINDVEYYEFETGIRNFNFVNELYGLYDGFLYDDLVELAFKYPTEIYHRTNKLYNDIHNLIHTTVWKSELSSLTNIH